MCFSSGMLNSEVYNKTSNLTLSSILKGVWLYWSVLRVSTDIASFCTTISKSMCRHILSLVFARYKHGVACVYSWSHHYGFHYVTMNTLVKLAISVLTLLPTSFKTATQVHRTSTVATPRFLYLINFCYNYHWHATVCTLAHITCTPA